MTDRHEMTRGPYIPESVHQRMVSLAEDKDMSVQDAYEELIKRTVNEDGNIVANTVKVKFGD